MVDGRGGEGCGKASDPCHWFVQKRWQIRQVVYASVLEALDVLFAELHIDYMPIKGAYLICTHLAELISAREMIDIDLLVRPTDFKRAIALLSAHPLFEREPADPWFFEQSFMFTHGNHRIHFELHSQLNRSERFLLDTDTLFDCAHKQTAWRVISPPEDALLVLVCHALVHLVDGIREQVCEEARLLSIQEGFSWRRFRSRLAATEIEPFCRALLYKAGVQPVLVDKPMKLFRPVLWARMLIAVKTPGRYAGIRTMVYRLCVELAFVRRPWLLLVGYARGWGFRLHRSCSPSDSREGSR